MRESKFANHEGKTITFNDGSGYSFNPLPTYTYNVNPNVIGSKIAGFTTDDTVTYAVEIGVRGVNAQDTSNKLDALLSLFKSDISANSYGRLTVNGYSLECFITGISPAQNLNTLKSVMATVLTDRPTWFKEFKTVQYTPDSVIIENSPSGQPLTSKSYPHGYPYGYPNPYKVKKITNELYSPAQFRLTVEGPCTPAITIGGHIYAVNADIATGETLIIDSRQKTVQKKTADGQFVNLFDSRNRDNFIFEPIPSGESNVSWQEINKFFITLIDERMIPPWSF